MEQLRNRIKYGTNQTKIADDIGISRSHISEVLAGKKDIGEHLARALGYKQITYYEAMK